MVAGAGTLTLQKDSLVVKQKKEVEAEELKFFYRRFLPELLQLPTSTLASSIRKTHRPG